MGLSEHFFFHFMTNKIEKEYRKVGERFCGFLTYNIMSQSLRKT